ncbi:MAG: T9SS type A sorting domain-containing protein [Bacteroidota bacterium]
MKKTLLLLCLFLTGLGTLSAQEPITVNVENILSECTDAIEILQSTLARREVELTINNPNTNALVYAYWVFSQDGVEIEVVEDAASGFWMRSTTLQFQVAIDAGSGDVPAGLESGIYEVALRLCYWKGVGATQTVNTQLEGSQYCSQSLVAGASAICCDIPLGCIDYTDCPDVSIQVNEVKGTVTGSVPSGANYWRLTVYDIEEGYFYYPFITNAELSPGCWNYAIEAWYPNGCYSVARGYGCYIEAEETPQGDFPFEGLGSGSTEAFSAAEYRRTASGQGLEPLLEAYPVPFTDQLTITTAAEDARLRIIDLSGRTIEQRQLRAGSTAVQTDRWPAGMYLLHLSDDTGLLEQRKVVKH